MYSYLYFIAKSRLERGLGVVFMVLNATFTNISAISWRPGSRSTRREPPTMGKQLVNLITCGCESSSPFFCNLQSQARTHAVLVIGLHELLDQTT